MSRIEIFDTLEQGTDEWRRVRAGIPTCSEFDLVRAKPGPRGGVTRELQGRTTYMRQLAGERITGEPMPHFETWAMRRGKEVEPQAARYYAITFDVELHRVGFVKNGNCGGSPDYLVGKDGGLEIKSADPHVQIERLETREIPSKHLWQCIGLLMVTGRRWWDYMSYSRGLPPLVLRIERDEATIASLRVDVDDFNRELDELVERIRSM